MAFLKRANRTVCSRCGNPIEKHRLPKYYYCLKCQYYYIKMFSKSYKDLPEEQKKRKRCRAYFNSYVKAGKIQRKPCEVCDWPEAEGHHENYDKPLEVIWLCVKHHDQWHGKPERKRKAVPKKRPVKSIQGRLMLAEQVRKRREAAERKRQETSLNAISREI